MSAIIKHFGPIDEDTADIIAEAFISAALKDQEVTFLLATYGGDFYAALALYDIIRAHPKPTKIIATGPCMSAGAVILQAGTIRAMTETAQLMVHYGASGSEEENDARQNDAMHKLHKEIISKRVSVSMRTVNSWFKNNTYFNSKRALEVSLVDEVIKCS